jgi:hypothetical protein
MKFSQGMFRTNEIVYPLSDDTCFMESRDGAVCIATGYRLDDRGVGVRVPVESRTFSSPRRPDRL